MGGAAARPILDRLLRYRGWLRGGRPFTAADAAAALEVSECTVGRDLKYLRTLGWDLEFCRSRREWRLKQEGTPRPLLRLRQGEWLTIRVGSEALQQYAGTPYAAERRRVVRAEWERARAGSTAGSRRDAEEEITPNK